MVNVPGRSKGCNTCRKRKIACSQERPACSQCLKSGRTCLGYSRQTIFVNSVVSPEPPSQKQQEESRKTTPATTNTRSADLPFPTVIVQQKRPETFKDSSSDGVESPPFPQTSDVVWSLCKSSARAQILGALVPPDAQASQSMPNMRWWMLSVPQISFPTKALETAAYAVSVAQVGQVLNDQSIIHESLKLYTQGLRRLQQALWDPELMYHDETLGACMLLSIYEIFQCPSGSRKAFRSHQSGCARLVKLRGPNAHVDGFGHLVFLGFRFMATLHALETKSTFLSEPEWKNIPFSIRPKSSLDKLLDIMLFAPSILQNLDRMNTASSPEKQLRVVVSLLRSCLEVEERLDSFYAELEKSSAQPLYWSVTSAEAMSLESRDASENSSIVFELAFRFSDLQTAVTLLFYWAFLNMLWSGMCHMYRVVSDLAVLSPTTSGELTGYFAPSADGTREAFRIPPPTRCKGFPDIARNVCQSTEFFMLQADLPGLTAPLQMVKEALSGFPGAFTREIAWVNSKLAELERGGLKIIRHLGD